VTKGQAALAISTGDYAEVVLEELARIEAEKIAEAAVNAHGALVAQVEKDLNASFERELTKERERVEALEKLAEEARMELDNLRA
jgi:methionyl-tRNA formyltransferase